MRKWVLMAAAGALALAGCGSSPEAEPSSDVNPEYEDGAESDDVGSAEDAAESEASDASTEWSAANNDPYPYTAVMTCGLNGFENINLMACLSGDVGTEIEITNDGNYGIYKVHNLPREWIYTDRGVEVPLSASFSIRMQNSSEDLFMGLRIYDNNNNVVFQKLVSRWGVISVSE